MKGFRGLINLQRDRDLDPDPDADRADRERRSRGLLGLRERDLKDRNGTNSVHFLSMKTIIQSLQRYCPVFVLFHEKKNFFSSHHFFIKIDSKLLSLKLNGFYEKI